MTWGGGTAHLLVASTAGNTLKDGVVVNLAPVSALDLSAEADELLADGILGGGVEHLGLHLGGIGAPMKFIMKKKKNEKRKKDRDQQNSSKKKTEKEERNGGRMKRRRKREDQK